MGNDEKSETSLTVVVNGTPQPITPGTSLLSMLNQMGIPLEGTAVELSGKIIPRQKYPETILEQGQHMEIVRMVGGG